MKNSNFGVLIRWEIEQYLNLPVLLFLIISAIIAVLAQTSSNTVPSLNYVNLYYGSGAVFVILTLVASAFFSRSFAGSIGRGEVKMMLSYPLQRRQLFLSKFTAMFVIIFVIYSAAYSLHLYLDNLSLLEPMYYLSLFAFLLQLMIACAVSVSISMVTKSDVMSILATVLLLLGLDSVAGTQSYLSAQGRFQVLFGYAGGLTHDMPPFGQSSVFTASDVATAILIPVLIFGLFICLSFVYFTRFMEID